MILRSVTLKLDPSSYTNERIRKAKKDFKLTSGAFIDDSLQSYTTFGQSLCWALSAASGLSVAQVATTVDKKIKNGPMAISESLNQLGINHVVNKLNDPVPTIAQHFRFSADVEYGPMIWEWDHKVYSSWRRFWYGLDMKEPESEENFPARRGRLHWSIEILG
jgi:hypothetical protein